MNIGIVISGGMAKGAYQVGALKAIREYLDPKDIRFLSAASIGSLNAYAFSSDRIDAAEELWRGVTSINKKVFVTTLFKSDYLRHAVEYLVKQKLNSEKFYVPVLQIKNMKLKYINFNEVPDDQKTATMQAAIAFPPFTMPIKLGNHLCCDGALIDNIPVYPFLNMELDYIICMYFDEYNYSFEVPDFDKKIIKITFNDNDKMLSNLVYYNKSTNDKMIESGYKSAKAVLDIVFSDGTDALEKIYAHIQTLNDLNGKKHIRITGDVALNNLNRIAKWFTKRKIID